MTINILHFTYSLSTGGRRNAIVNLSNGLSKKEVNNFACSVNPITDKEYQELCNASIIEIPSLDSQSHYLNNLRKLLYQLETICIKNDINLIHSHDASSQIISAFLVSKTKLFPHVYTFHRSLPLDTKGIKNKLRNFYANKHTNIITVGSNDRKNHYLNNNYFINKNKVKIIPFGIELEKYKHSSEQRKIIRSQENFSESDIVLGCIGHFGKEKGIDIIIHAFSKLISEANITNIKLVIAGTGNKNETIFINSLCRKLNLQNKVTFTGFDSNIERWYSSFDIFIHAARTEAFGLVLVEAMAAGLPIVASRVGGMIDIVAHGKSGYLVETENPKEIADAVLKLINNPELLHQFGNNGYKIAKSNYSLDIFANAYLELYSQLIN